MIQVTPQMRILVAIEAVDFRCGIDGLSRLVREKLSADPFSGSVFVFRNRSQTSVKALVYDGQGFWLCQKRISEGRFRYWPSDAGQKARELFAHELSVLLCAGDFEKAKAAPEWRPVRAQS